MTRKKLIYALKILFILLMIVPVCLTCFYIMPAADDFANSYGTRELLESYESYLLAALVRTKGLYEGTSGYYTSAFTNTFFSPLLRNGIFGLRIFCCIINILFYITLFILTKITLKNLADITEKNAILTVYIMFLFCFTNVYLNVESSFWYCVSAAYVLVMIFMLLGISFFIKGIFTQKKYYMILATILGFLASGCSLNVAAMNCFFYLLLAVYSWIRNRCRRSASICFGFTLLGGIINLICPANYVRHNENCSEYYIGMALFDSANLVFSRLYKVFQDSLLPWVLILLFTYFLVKAPQIRIYKHLHPISVAIIFTISLMVFDFPVCLGYVRYFPDRCIFVHDTAMYIFLFVWTAYSAAWIRERYPDMCFDKTCIQKTCFILFVPFCMWHTGKTLENAYPSIYLIKQIANGNNTTFVNHWTGILDEIATSPENNVVIKRETFYNPTLLMTPGFGEDSEYWVNKYVAWYYGKESLTLIYYENTEEN